MNDFAKIQKAVEHLNTGELKACLKFVLQHISLFKEQTASRETAIDRLMRLYDRLVERDAKPQPWDPAPGCTHVHIVTGESFAGGMKVALRDLGLSDAHKLMTIRHRPHRTPRNAGRTAGPARLVPAQHRLRRARG